MNQIWTVWIVQRERQTYILTEIERHRETERDTERYCHHGKQTKKERQTDI